MLCKECQKKNLGNDFSSTCLVYFLWKRQRFHQQTTRANRGFENSVARSDL